MAKFACTHLQTSCPLRTVHVFASRKLKLIASRQAGKVRFSPTRVSDLGDCYLIFSILMEFLCFSGFPYFLGFLWIGIWSMWYQLIVGLDWYLIYQRFGGIVPFAKRNSTLNLNNIYYKDCENVSDIIFYIRAWCFLSYQQVIWKP